MPVTRHTQRGFALFIVAALFMAFALLAVSMIDRTNATQNIDRSLKTREQMARIYYALIQFSIDNNNRYPCPADPAVAYTSASFGTPIANCHSGVSGSVVQLTPPGTSVAIRGTVPVLSLLPYGIKPSDAFDVWGNRIMYVVDRQMTPLGTGTAGATTDRPVVNEDNLGATVFKSADFVLLSFGRDGLGATPRTQTAVSIACTAIGDPREINCDTDRTFSARPLYTGPAATQALYFDDIIMVFSAGSGV